ncbi:MAG: Rpn family recombination-promoting nuclease/putative transposase [Campylobacterota bacterium]|nr:Rpn family recombination-promoting nuclease/putative transposase [Campylobacterota bacterium]
MCMIVKNKYIDPFTDFGFKWIFGTEENKQLLISFLNDLLELEDKIVNVTYRNLEKLGLNITDRKAVFDIFCTDEKDNDFIVELQRGQQQYFKDRSIFYTSFPIQDMSKKGDWNYNLKKIYFIGILEFTFDDMRKSESKKTVSIKKEDRTYMTKVQLCDTDTKELFYDKLTYIYIEMPKFKKSEKELANHLEKWLYFLNNVEDLSHIPKEFKDDEVLENAFDIAEFLALDEDKKFAYQHDLKTRLDYKNIMDYAKSKAEKLGVEIGMEIGIEKGIENRNIEIVEKSFKKGLDIDTICDLIELPFEEVSRILDKIRK